MPWHIIYDSSGPYTGEDRVLEAEIEAPSFAEAEKWAKAQGATWWEIAFIPPVPQRDEPLRDDEFQSWHDDPGYW